MRESVGWPDLWWGWVVKVKYDSQFRPGTVWLVGGGPGDPDLLTLKAERLLRRADIVFYDALVGPGVLELIGPEA